MSDWTICTGGEADIPSVLGLWEAAETLRSSTDTQDALERLLSRDPESLLIACTNGRVIGSLIVAWDGWRGSFYRLAVHPRWRRGGVATALIRAGERHLRDLGAVRLTAIVAGDEHAAISLWEAAGYEAQADVSRFVRMLGG